MEIFKCKYLTHENEEIIGFCLNQNCQNATQYCYECLNMTHSEHFNDCIRFTKMNQFINEFMQGYNQQRKQLKEISQQLQNCFEQILKKMDQDIKILENMNQRLLNKDYLQFKSQIHIIKQFYSKEKENYIQQQLLQLHNILDTIKKMVPDQIQQDDQINSIQQKHIKIEELSDNQKQQNIQEAQRINKEGVALDSLQKYQEAIECYNKAIEINPKFEQAWNNKGSALYSLQKYQEAIECYNKAIEINPKIDYAWSNKGAALHQLQKYKEAILCYDQALSICVNPLRLKLKADSLFQLGNKNEAKQFYLAALEQGSNEKDYIKKQLSKL